MKRPDDIEMHMREAHAWPVLDDGRVSLWEEYLAGVHELDHDLDEAIKVEHTHEEAEA